MTKQQMEILEAVNDASRVRTPTQYDIYPGADGQSEIHHHGPVWIAVTPDE
jgi:hypothetical protein